MLGTVQFGCRDPSRCDGIEQPPRLDPTTLGTRQVPLMIASSGFGLLALFSLLSILLGEDRRRTSDPTDLLDAEDMPYSELRWSR